MFGFNSKPIYFAFMIFRWVHVLNNSRTEALEKAFGDSDKAEVLVSVVLVMKEVVLLHPTNHFSS